MTGVLVDSAVRLAGRKAGPVGRLSREHASHEPYEHKTITMELNNLSQQNKQTRWTRQAHHGGVAEIHEKTVNPMMLYHTSKGKESNIAALMR